MANMLEAVTLSRKWTSQTGPMFLTCNLFFWNTHNLFSICASLDQTKSHRSLSIRLRTRIRIWSSLKNQMGQFYTRPLCKTSMSNPWLKHRGRLCYLCLKMILWEKWLQIGLLMRLTWEFLQTSAKTTQMHGSLKQADQVSSLCSYWETIAKRLVQSCARTRLIELIC